MINQDRQNSHTAINRKKITYLAATQSPEKKQYNLKKKKSLIQLIKSDGTI